MTQDEIIEMAREAGFRVGPSRDGPDDVWGIGVNLETFANLVAAKEREACAKMCEQMDSINDNYGERIELICAEAIRARGEQA